MKLAAALAILVASGAHAAGTAAEPAAPHAAEHATDAAAAHGADAVPQRVQVGVKLAAVKDSALDELGLDPTMTDGLALPKEHESRVMSSFRLLTLQEQKKATMIAMPMMLLEVGQSQHLDEATGSTFDFTARRAGSDVMIDVAVQSNRLAKGASLRGTGPLGDWAVLAKSKKKGETIVAWVESQVDEGE
jgi:hypothetical protein